MTLNSAIFELKIQFWPHSFIDKFCSTDGTAIIYDCKYWNVSVLIDRLRLYESFENFKLFSISQNVVGFVQMIVAWAIPDVPRKLDDRIKREEYLTREIIIEHELQRAAAVREHEREQSLTKSFGNVFRLRKANGDNVAISEL